MSKKHNNNSMKINENNHIIYLVINFAVTIQLLKSRLTWWIIKVNQISKFAQKSRFYCYGLIAIRKKKV